MYFLGLRAGAGNSQPIFLTKRLYLALHFVFRTLEFILIGSSLLFIAKKRPSTEDSTHGSKSDKKTIDLTLHQGSANAGSSVEISNEFPDSGTELGDRKQDESTKESTERNSIETTQNIY